eukprot:TRINITY_DN63149_c0_g1_i1.p1 TRINITY_DN63149_c0_g1~~TRINITY_DN63149_c0_g1_i1.p1  ORF type:complete len:119 (+),score=13.80 TRINITY_DN63149_c0_g1_i1:139-495(+)
MCIRDRYKIHDDDLTVDTVAGAITRQLPRLGCAYSSSEIKPPAPVEARFEPKSPQCRSDQTDWAQSGRTRSFYSNPTQSGQQHSSGSPNPVSYTHLRAHETPEHLVCRLLLEKKKIRQ